MNGKEVKHCSLCFHNGEPEDYYRCDFPFFIERVWPIILSTQGLRVIVIYSIVTSSALTIWRLAMEKSWLVQFFASLSATSVELPATWPTLSGWLHCRRKYVRSHSSTCQIQSFLHIPGTALSTRMAPSAAGQVYPSWRLGGMLQAISHLAGILVVVYVMFYRDLYFSFPGFSRTTKK